MGVNPLETRIRKIRKIEKEIIEAQKLLLSNQDNFPDRKLIIYLESLNLDDEIKEKVTKLLKELKRKEEGNDSETEKDNINDDNDENHQKKKKTKKFKIS